MTQKTQRLLFLGLVVALLGARTLASGSLSVAIGMGFIEIPAALVFGRITLWFADRLLLFARNIRNRESPKRDYERTIWQTLSLSLAIGLPLWLLASQG